MGMGSRLGRDLVRVTAVLAPSQAVYRYTFPDEWAVAAGREHGAMMG